jgi:hypothetical protein
MNKKVIKVSILCLGVSMILSSCVSTARISDFSTDSSSIDFEKYTTELKISSTPSWLNKKSNELIAFENTLKEGNDDSVKDFYYKKARELGHTEKEMKLFWDNFNKSKNDNRFLKNLASVRAKYVK